MKEKQLSEGTARHAFEFLKLINGADGEEQERLMKKWGNNSPLNMLLSLNFNDRLKLDLPPGMPPHKMDEHTHPDMFSPLAAQIMRLKVCQVGNGIKKMDKERVFIQVLENVPPKDAEVLVAAKDKALDELFPNIKKELVEKLFPNFVK